METRLYPNQTQTNITFVTVNDLQHGQTKLCLNRQLNIQTRLLITLEATWSNIIKVDLDEWSLYISGLPP